ncbi:MAG: DUF1580 domain-containing protein [Gemmataceae bacterium]
MIVNDTTDDLIPLSQLAKFLPPPLKHVHASTATRWALRGVGNPRVKIETVKIGGRRFVTRSAVERWVARLTGGEAMQAANTLKRQQQYQDADDELAADGL